MPIIWCSMPVVCWSCPEIGPSRLVIQQSLCRFHPVLRIDRPICLVRPDWDVAIQRTEMGCGNYGNPWKPMETHGNPWKPMETLICEGATKATNLQLKKVQNSWTTLAVAKTLVKFSCAWEKKWNNHRWQKNDFQSFSWRIHENSTSNSIIVTKHIAELAEKQMSY